MNARRFPAYPVFFAMARIYRRADDAISLRDIWTIADGELNKAAGVACGRLRDEMELADLHREVAWSAQALIEFADLANFTHSGKGRVQYKNYLYFEAVHALREATVGMLNGSPRASTGLLRSVLEITLLHCWWQKCIERKGSSEQFYDWLEGRRSIKPKFRDMVANNFEWLEIPADPAARDDVQRTYDRLCSYVHAPIREESVTMLNRGNVSEVGVGVLRHWLVLARDALRIALEQLVHLYPQCLFPVDINRKFGFNPPVGMYFDRFNFVPLEAVFGAARIDSWRARLQNHTMVEGAMNFYKSRPDLTDEQVLQTWDDTEGPDGTDRDTDDPVVLWFKVKARMRVLSMVLTYSEPVKPHW